MRWVEMARACGAMARACGAAARETCAIESPHFQGDSFPHSHMLKWMRRPVLLRAVDIDWYDCLMSIPKTKMRLQKQEE